MTTEQIKDFNRIAEECSNSSWSLGGSITRQCNFCGRVLFINEVLSNHKEDCPITTMLNVLEIAVNSKKGAIK